MKKEKTFVCSKCGYELHKSRAMTMHGANKANLTCLQCTQSAEFLHNLTHVRKSTKKRMAS